MNLSDFLATFTATNWCITIGLFGISHIAAFVCGYHKMRNECRRRLRDQADAQTERIARKRSYLHAV